jgi:amino acid transporter
MALALAKAGQLPGSFSRLIWREGSQGVLLGIGAILLVINVFDLSDLASIASATFLITYLAVHVAHWRLIEDTKASRWLVALGLASMAAVLACFLWTSFSARPWSVATIVIFLAGSWMVDLKQQPSAVIDRKAEVADWVDGGSHRYPHRDDRRHRNPFRQKSSIIIATSDNA